VAVTGAEPESPLLAESVHATLREQILSGELPAGTPLSVPAFAASLNVSRSPVREAVQQLMYEGIAVHVPYAGARVAEIDDVEIAAVFAVRRELEGLAAETAATTISTAGIASLREILQRQRERMAQSPDDRADRLLDVEFHTAIRETTLNRHLCDSLARLDVLSHLYRSAMWNDDINRGLALTEHERIVDALEHGDAVAARATASAHVSGLLTRMFRNHA
jgi:DNA-binding GntR family transcriptional regulator